MTGNESPSRCLRSGGMPFPLGKKPGNGVPHVPAQFKHWVQGELRIVATAREETADVGCMLA